jgi:hypothetical protein
VPQPPATPNAARFAAHGSVSLESSTAAPVRILRFEATGPFNVELAHELREALTPIYIDAAAEGPFGDITTFYRSMLAPAEAFAAFTALIADWRAARIAPTVAAYVVGPEVEGRNVVLAVYRNAWAGIPFEVFDSQEDADAWVKRTMTQTR